MAWVVVEALEVLDVDEQQADRAARGPGLTESLLEQTSVAHAGQRIGFSQAEKPAIDRVELSIEVLEFAVALHSY